MATIQYATFHDAVLHLLSLNLPAVGDIPKWIDYKTNQGRLRMTSGEGELCIHYIEVDKKLRRTGIFTKFIKILTQDKRIKKICICGVSSYNLIFALAKFEKTTPFVDQGGDFIWKRPE